MRKSLKVSFALLLLIIILSAGGGAYWYFRTPHASAASAPVAYKTPQEAASVDVRFAMEAYDTIEADYWQTPTDAQMAQLFQASAQKALSLDGLTATTTLPTTDRAGTAAMLAAVFDAATSSAAKAQLAVGVVQVALYNLAPAGRSELLSQSAQTQLAQEVNNVNPGQNLYDDVGATTGASVSQVKAAYAQTKQALEASSSPQAKQKLAQATYAARVLTNPQNKAQYDSNGAQPTVFNTVFGTTLYVYIKQMAPTTLREFQNALDSASTTSGLSSLIVDLRGNIGGSLDDAAAFLGLFEGPNQYAYDLYGQGTYNVVRTTGSEDPALARYGEIAVLTDDMTQSTAEILTASFKRFHIATAVGATTRGWGTVEATYPLTTTPDASSTYALLLVHDITLRDDQQPIQGTGVVPNVSITDANWKSQLSNYFRSPSMINTLEKTADSTPIQ